MSWRQPGTTPTAISRRVTVTTETEKTNEEHDTSFQLPSNEVQATTDNSHTLEQEDDDVLSPFNNGIIVTTKSLY